MAIIDLEKEGVLDASLAASFYAKYDPKEVLGTGASSTVRRCICKDTKEEFAVKILDLNSGYDTSEVLKLECLREVSVLKQIAGHSNIIKLQDMYEGEAYVFMVFELCKGGELFDYLTKMVTLSEKRTRMIMRQLIDAVSFVHSKGIVHRDLKPENILLDADMNVKLTDFGFAVFLTDKEELQETRGTPGYLAPEVLRCGYYEGQPPYGQAVDIWACGVIMYTLLVGFPPFWNRKEYLMLRQIMTGVYAFPSPEWDEISDVAKDMIRCMLVVDPEARIKPAEALNHEFFTQSITVHDNLKSNGRIRFRASFIAISFIRCLRELKACSTCLSINKLTTDPYSNKRLRKLIDVLAFDVYSHWIKRGDDQNRAALYENRPRSVLVTQTSESDTLDREDTLENTGEDLEYISDHYGDVFEENIRLNSRRL